MPSPASIMSPGRTRRPLMIALGDVPVITPVMRALSIQARKAGVTTGTDGTELAVLVVCVTGLNCVGGGGSGAIGTGSGAGGKGAKPGLGATGAVTDATLAAEGGIGRRKTKYTATPTTATTKPPSKATRKDFLPPAEAPAGLTGECSATGGGGVTGGGIGIGDIGTAGGAISDGPPPACEGGRGLIPGMAGAPTGVIGMIGAGSDTGIGGITAGGSIVGGGAEIEVSGLSFSRGISPGIPSKGAAGGGASTIGSGADGTSGVSANATSGSCVNLGFKRKRDADSAAGAGPDSTGGGATGKGSAGGGEAGLGTAVGSSSRLRGRRRS